MSAAPKLLTHVLYFGQPVVIACDARCDKAWGMNGRPEGVADAELGLAPTDPGTYEGGDAKPDPWPPLRHNKWCARECERSVIVKLEHPIVLPTL